MPRALALAFVPALALSLVVLAACGEDESRSEAAPAGKLVSEVRLGPAAAALRMEPAAPRFGDRVRLVLDVDLEAGASLDAWTPGVRFGHWRLRDREGPEDLGGGRARWTFAAEAERTGRNIGQVPPLAFRVASGEGAGTRRELVLPPFEVEVAGLTEGEVPKLAGILEPLGPVPLARRARSTTLWWTAAGAVLAALALGAFLWWRRRRAAPAAAPAVDPEEEARRALEALLGAGLLEQGLHGEFYLRLTGIVRRFIERTTGVHAPEQTTEEFLRAMEGSPRFTRGRKEALRDFLGAADLVKFAAQVPERGETEAAVAAARSFCGREAEPVA